MSPTKQRNKGKKKKNKNTESSLELLVQMQEMRLSDGAYDSRKSDKGDEITLGYKNVYTPNSVKVVYVVNNMPMFIQREWLKKLRWKIERYGICVNYIVRMSPHRIDWESPQMKHHKEASQRYLEQAKNEKIDNFSSVDDLIKKEKQNRIDQSYGYYHSVERRSKSLCRCDISIELERVRHDKEARHNFKLSKANLKKYCIETGISTRPLKYNLLEYFITRMPTSSKLNSDADFDRKFILSDEIVSRFLGFYGGDIGNSGIPIGRDIHRNKLVYKNFISKSGSAENSIVVAETGVGKSVFLKTLCQMCAGNLFNVIILDIDGEHKPFAEENNGIVISFSDSYFDTMEISNPTGEPSVDKQLLNESRKATSVTFDCLMNLNNGMDDTERSIFGKIYNRLYAKVGILVDDMSTWGNSKRLRYHDVYEMAKELCNPEDAKDMNIELKDLRNFTNKLYPYLDKEGMFSYLFQKKISINDIIDRKSKEPAIVDIVLDLQNIATSGYELIEQSIKQNSATYLMNVLANHFKKMGQFTMEVIEEYNRYARAQNISSMLLSIFTGNRKKNVNAILVTNSPMDLLKSGSVESYAIIDNIQNYFIGSLKPKTIDAVCETFGLEDCKRSLKKLSSNPKYKHCFLVRLDNKDTAVCKWDIPEDLINSRMYKSRDTEQKDKEILDVEWKDIESDVMKKKELGRELNRKTFDNVYI